MTFPTADEYCLTKRSFHASQGVASEAANAWAGTAGAWSVFWPRSPTSAALPSATGTPPTSPLPTTKSVPVSSTGA